VWNSVISQVFGIDSDRYDAFYLDLRLRLAEAWNTPLTNIWVKDVQRRRAEWLKFGYIMCVRLSLGSSKLQSSRVSPGILRRRFLFRMFFETPCVRTQYS